VVLRWHRLSVSHFPSDSWLMDTSSSSGHPNSIDSDCDVVPISVKLNRKKRRAQYRAKKRREAAQAVSSVYDPLASISPSVSVIPSSYMRTSSFTPTLACIMSLRARNPSALSELPPPIQQKTVIASSSAPFSRHVHRRTRIHLPSPSTKQ